MVLHAPADDLRTSAATPYRIQVIDRAVQLLDSFAIDRPELSMSDLVGLTGLSKPTVHRLLVVLHGHHIVERNEETKRYRLGFKLFELGNRVIARLDYGKGAEAYLRRLVDETGETANLAVLDNGLAYYVAKVEGTRPLRMPSRVGTSLPAHATAVGKVLLAHLSSASLESVLTHRPLVAYGPRSITDRRRLEAELQRIREQGYGIDDEEIDEGLRCVAAPVRDHTGSVVAAISVSGPVSRLTDDAIAGLAHRLMETAREVSASFGLVAS
jgi:DNA-binding IclR family transcriptional regulator